MRDLSTRAFEIEFATHRTLKESVDLFRIGAREVDANPDGIDFSGPMFEALGRTGLFTREASLDPTSMPSRTAIDLVTQNMQTGMAHLWQVTPGNSRSEQIVAGQDWVRMNLAATALGPWDATPEPGASGVPRDGRALRPGARQAGPRRRNRANVGTPRLRSRRAAEPPLAAGRQDCQDLTGTSRRSSPSSTRSGSSPSSGQPLRAAAARGFPRVALRGAEPPRTAGRRPHARSRSRAPSRCRRRR